MTRILDRHHLWVVHTLTVENEHTRKFAFPGLAFSGPTLEPGMGLGLQESAWWLGLCPQDLASLS